MLTNETRLIYDGLLPIQERDAGNNPLVTYTRGLDLSGSIHGAGGIGGLLARTDGNGSAFYHSDGIGNVTALMDGDGDIVARYLYNPFGRLVGKWGALADVNVMRFSSMPEHRGLMFYHARAYDPNLQRWLTQDPLDEEGGINLFSFVANDPVNMVDDWGMQPVMNTQIRGVVANPAINQQIYEDMQLARPIRPGWEAMQARDRLMRRPAPANMAFRGPFTPPRVPSAKEMIDYWHKSLMGQRLTAEPCPPKGSLNPATRAASARGSSLHSDKLGNLPDQLRSMFPETQFRFTPSGTRGQDVEVVGGMHPSFYPYANWRPGVNFGDFKPNTPSGARTFRSDQNSKWNAPTQMLSYDPATGKIVTGQ